jgi:hypothetical protein
MGVIAQFSYANWDARFPEFATTVNETQAGLLFNEATLLQRNDGGGPIYDANSQITLLNLVVAHLAQLYFGSTISTASPIVGRISGANEGSVSVQTENQYPPGTVQYWQQTKYGSEWWVLTAPYRTMRYVAGPRYNPDPYWFGRFDGRY